MSHRFPIFMILLFAALAACTNNADESTVAESDTPSQDEQPSLRYTLTPFEPSQEFPDASIRSMTYKDGRFDFEVGGGSYQLGVQTPDAAAKGCANSAEGQHIHLIVDNLPYAAKYEASFDYEIPDGDHHLLAFLSRSYHESIKSQGASILVNATIENNTITSSEPVTEPMLFYSRPKGVYNGDADTKRVMLDYYMVNANPAEYTVRANINGELHELDTWQPYYIEGLPAGENTITLTLMRDNEQVMTDLNPVTRKFVLNPDPVGGN